MRNQLWALLLVILVGSSYAKVFRPPSHSHVRRQQIDETSAESLAEYDPTLNLPEEIPEKEPITSEASEETSVNAIPEDAEPIDIAPKSIDAATLAPVTEQALLSADGKKMLTEEEAKQVKDSFINDPKNIEKLRNQAGIDEEEITDEIKKGVQVHRDKNGGYYVVLRFDNKNHKPENADGEEIYDSEIPDEVIPEPEDKPEKDISEEDISEESATPATVTEKITDESAEEKVDVVPEVDVVPGVDAEPEVDAEVDAEPEVETATEVKPAEAPSTEETEVIVAPDAEEPAQEEVVETTQVPVDNSTEAPEKSGIKYELPQLDVMKEFDTSIFSSVWFLILLLCCFI